MSMKELIEISNRYGADEEYVLAGGGNTSWKTDEYMYVKGSGTELATIGEEGFVKVNLKKLDKIWTASYSDNDDAREEEVLADLMASRYPSEKEKRPSVETLLHALLPYKFVVHTHPALVNGITCSRSGEQTVLELFGDTCIWVPMTNPGYILAKEVKEAIEKHMNGGKDFPLYIFLQNHGVFVSGNSIKEIDDLYEALFGKIKSRINKFPVTDEKHVDSTLKDFVVKTIENVLGEDKIVLAFTNSDIERFSASSEAFSPLELSYTPDHIVYYGFKPLYAESIESFELALRDYIQDNNAEPRLAVISRVGAFAFSNSQAKAEKAKVLFLDDVKIAVYVESFGGHQFMPEDKINFIRNWEVEKYRASVGE